MKKTLLALGAACIALSGMAATPQQKLLTSAKSNLGKIADIKTKPNFHSEKSASLAKRATAAFGPEDVVETAEGTTQAMAVVSSGYYYSMFGLIQYEDMESASNVVYAENDEVYFQDIIPFAGMETYVKGIKKDNKIEVSFPQTVIFYEDEGYGLFMCLMEKDAEAGEDEVNYIPTEDASVTFTVSEDGSLTAEGLSDDLILGYAYTDDYTWCGFGASKLEMTPFNEKPVEAPEDIEVSKGFWTYNAGDYGWPVNWAQGYDEVYFQGLSADMPEAWVMGTVEYDDTEATISIAQNQYLGIASGAFIYTKCAKFIYDEDGVAIDAEMMPADYQFQLVWDYEENTLVAKDPEVLFVLNCGDGEYYALNYFEDMKLAHQEDYSGTPANPYNLFFDDTYDYYGFGAFQFVVPAISTDGDVLDTKDLYYVVYVDDEEWEFYAEEYGIEEDLVEIPWNLSEYYIYNWGGAMRETDFFVEGISTLGVQSVYKYNGEETRSEIVTLDLDDPTAVGSLTSDKKVASVKYYDVSGRQVANPGAGIVIKRVVYEDGTVASFKKAVR